MTTAAAAAATEQDQPKVLVINHQAKLVHATLPHKSGTPTVHTLKPGTNAFDKALWEQLVATKIIKRGLEAETITVHGAAGADISKMKVTKAVEVIKLTFDPALLARWAEDDKRGAVQKAIKAQLEALDGSKPSQ